MDKISVALPHPDAATAIIKGGTGITGHVGNPPFQEQKLAGKPEARIVLNSSTCWGGPASETVLYASKNFARTTRKPTRYS